MKKIGLFKTAIPSKVSVLKILLSLKGYNFFSPFKINSV